VVTDLIEMGRWHFGDRDILIVFDAGYDAPRMAHLLGGVEVLGRIRSDRVMRRPTPSRRGWIVAFLLVVLTFGAGLASRRRRIPRLLTGLGTISYSVYLLTVLLHLNLLTYRYIESPSQTSGRRLAHREVLPARRGGAAPEIDRSSGLG
jgi:peptidoglycan/LPS O-acetylase OafA/YrhL